LSRTVFAFNAHTDGEHLPAISDDKGD
jgi:hypothetical protein